jgi:Ni/Co efflux regulator RcnB
MVHHAVRHAVRHAAATHRFAHLRHAIHATHRYHIGTYRRPHGWYAHHWVVGAYLPGGWYGRDYWIVDFGLYGLIAPPDGLVWVRVGPDVMLIDPDTGEVIQVVYGIFW